MKLSDLKDSDKAVIVKVLGYGAFRKRITEMGFVKGQTVTVVKNAPLKDPVEYSIMGYDISLRRSEAALIEVVKLEEGVTGDFSPEFHGVFSDDELKQTLGDKSQKKIHVAFVGNPNCGKTTLYNMASGSTEHVGNYSGVTVDAKQSSATFGDYKFELVDLPGTYSLTAYSQEERYVRQYIVDNKPDIVINVVDASNLERNLYLTTQLIDMDIKVVIALNMYDELEAKGAILDYKKLGAMLGVPIIPTVGSKGKGLDKLFTKLIDVYEDRDPVVRHIHINYGAVVEDSIKRMREIISKDSNIVTHVSSRFLAVKLLERCRDASEYISTSDFAEDIQGAQGTECAYIEDSYKENTETVITDAKYGFITGALKETYRAVASTRRKSTDMIDAFITHKFWGIPIFLFFMFVTFYATFTFGQYPQAWIESGVAWIGSMLSNYMPAGPLKDLLIDGVVGGVGGVIVFLPNILILFLFISFMEDTGYMARAAFITDRVMHKIGLHGKSFIPLVMGFGCNVPAIMATRTLENRNDRLLTILINPFMSCSARLPIYIVIIGAFFSTNAALVLFSMYGIGIFLAVIIARLFKKVLFKSKEAPFVMELPPYRVPVLKVIISHMWSKASQYLKKMGGIILVASVIIWALGYFPKDVDYSKDYDTLIEDANQDIVQAKIDNNVSLIDMKNKEVLDYNLAKQEEHQMNSYIGRIGQFISPVMKPLGFDWKMSVSLLSGIVAKEVIVSTMGVLYQVDEGSYDLESRLRDSNVFNSLIAFVFMLFILIYFPCIAVIVTVAKEAGWKWSAFLAVYTTVLAWGICFVVYNIGVLLL